MRRKPNRRLLRESLYRVRTRILGVVRCFVCGGIVTKEQASLEHIVPLSQGGGDNWMNLDISHKRCNTERGSPRRLSAPPQ